MSRARSRITPLLLGALGLLPMSVLSAQILVVAEDAPAIRSFADALAARRPDDDVRFQALSEVPAASELDPDERLVTLGKAALEWRLQSQDGPPTLALLISRVQAHGLKGAQRKGVSLLWSDPPPLRQLRLIRLILPNAKRIGLLYNDRSAFLLPEMQAAAKALDLTLIPQAWTDPRDTETLNQLLRGTDTLLGLDDPDLYNPRTAKSLLLTSYGQNRALFGPSAAFVRAGSLASSYSDQSDWLDVLDTLLDQPPSRWPRSLYPSHFKVVGNRQVARSLGIRLPDDETLTRQLTQGERK